MPSENILSYFWDLAATDEKKRLKAATQLSYALSEAQEQFHGRQVVQVDKECDDDNDAGDDKEELFYCCDELKYSVTRLVKGLASSRKAARQGFATALTEVLSKFECLTPQKVLRLIAKNLEATGSAKAPEERDCYFGQVFGLTSILRSQFKQEKISSPNSEWLCLLIARLQEISKKKSYLHEICAKVIADIVMVVSTDVFTNSVYPSVKAILESGWDQATPEKLLIALALQRCWGDHLDKKIIKEAWKCSLIADKKNYPQIGAVLQDSISAHPRVHCVWDEIFLTSFFENPASDFQLFWNTVVEERLFESTHDRKFLGFQLVKKILPQISANQVPVVFSTKMMRTFKNSLTSTETYLYEAAKQLASSLPALVNQNKDSEAPLSVLKQLLGWDGSIYFDQLTKTKTVENLLGTLNGSGLPEFSAWLLEIFYRGFAVGSPEPEPGSVTKTVELNRITILNQLFQLIKKKTVSHEGDWVKEVLLFFLEQAYFQAVQGDPEVPLTLSVRKICEQRFVSAMKELSSSKEMKQVELYKVVQHAKKLLDDDIHKVVSNQWTEEAENAFKKAVKLVEKIQKKRRKSEERCQEDEVFEILLSHMALHLFIEPEQAIDILKELKACYRKQKNRRNEDNTEEPHWVEVLTEVLLSLLTRPSSLFRHVVDQVFTVLAPHLTLNALNMCLESLNSRKGAQGETLEIVDGSADEEEDNDEEMKDDVDAKDKEAANGGMGDENEGDDDDDDDDNDEEENSSGDEEDALGELDEAFRAQVKAALGPSMVDTDKEGSGSDEDLDDEAMMKLDDGLAAVFISQLQAKKEKRNKKDTTEMVLHFKLRVLDLIEIFIKKQASNPLIVEVMIPLLEVAWSSLGSKDFRTLGEKAEGLFKKKLCSSKELPPISSIDAKDIHDKIDQLVQKAMSAPSIDIMTLITRACFYLVRVLRGSEAQESSVTPKVSLLNTQRFSAAFKKALEDFMERRSTHLHLVFFTDLINRYPHLGWLLAADLVKYLETARSNYMKSQACQMLLQLMPKKTPDRSRHMTNIAPSLQTMFVSLMTNASASETELKVKHVREILKVMAKFVNEAKKTNEVFPLLHINELKEGVTLFQESALFKKAPGMKSICNIIYSNLSRDRDGNEKKHKKAKRKREVTEHSIHESASGQNGVDSSQMDIDGAKKRKKKKRDR